MSSSQLTSTLQTSFPLLKKEGRAVPASLDGCEHVVLGLLQGEASSMEGDDCYKNFKKLAVIFKGKNIYAKEWKEIV